MGWFISADPSAQFRSCNSVWVRWPRKTFPRTAQPLYEERLDLVEPGRGCHGARYWGAELRNSHRRGARERGRPRSFDHLQPRHNKSWAAAIQSDPTEHLDNSLAKLQPSPSLGGRRLALAETPASAHQRDQVGRDTLLGVHSRSQVAGSDQSDRDALGALGSCITADRSFWDALPSDAMSAACALVRARATTRTSVAGRRHPREPANSPAAFLPQSAG
jgi:hypothetical protein